MPTLFMTFGLFPESPGCQSAGAFSSYEKALEGILRHNSDRHWGFEPVTVTAKEELPGEYWKVLLSRDRRPDEGWWISSMSVDEIGQDYKVPCIFNDATNTWD